MKDKKTGSKQEKKGITKDMPFSEVLQKYPAAAKVFFEHGMSCVGCPMAMSETVEQGCLAHGLDPDKIIEEINKTIKKKK